MLACESSFRLRIVPVCVTAAYSSLVVANFQVHDRVLSSSFEGQGDGPGLEASPKVFEIHLALGQSLVQARIIIHYLDPKNPAWLV